MNAYGAGLIGADMIIPPDNPWREMVRDVQGPQNRHQIQVLKHDRLVYLRTLKCASTFFFYNFQSWGWQPINFYDIDWANDHVFSYIMEPIERRHKGIAEWISMQGHREQFYRDAAYRQIIALTPALDMHSVAMTNIYGQFVNMIDWIPMTDFSPAAVTDFTDRLLWDHGIHSRGRWDQTSTHASDPDMKQLQQDVATLYRETVQKDIIAWYFYQDILLHTRVIERFDHRQIHWTDMSWLRR